ncbi:hypothetical protein [Streptomyces sp. NBC_01341]|uniref:hypothetical protein n=1 Tax=Streptomyces sp. NBC_01341 TaxID=2903831 RepID=UPI003FA393BB
MTTPRGSTTRTYASRGPVIRIDYSDTRPLVALGPDDSGRTPRADAEIAEGFVYNSVGDLTNTRGFACTYQGIAARVAGHPEIVELPLHGAWSAPTARFRPDLSRMREARAHARASRRRTSETGTQADRRRGPRPTGAWQ